MIFRKIVLTFAGCGGGILAIFGRGCLSEQRRSCRCARMTTWEGDERDAGKQTLHVLVKVKAE